MNELPRSIIQLRKMLVEGQLAPNQILENFVSAIKEHDGLLNSFISTVTDLAEEPNRAAGPGKRDGMHQPLADIPFSVKDLIFTDRLPATCGSRAPIPDSVTSREQATVVTRLLRAGAVMAGKNNLHEYAFGITNENDHFGPVRNPCNPSRMSGGSSGGSAAAVAAGLVAFSVGTDTRGSIRIPSSCCGVTGLKPTFGRLPVSGVVPLSSSLDHVGPITWDVADSELVYKAMLGEFAIPGAARPSNEHSIQTAMFESSGTLIDRDSFSAVRDIRESLGEMTDLRIGICEYYFTHVSREVSAAVFAALDFFRGQGIEVREISMPLLDAALEASDVVSRAEGYTFHRRNLEKHRDGYGEPVARRLESGRDLSAVDLVEALEIKRQITRDFREVFREVDCLLAPTLPVTAPPLGTSELDIEGWKEPIVHGFVRFNAPQNMAGVPCITFPCGFDSAGLPIGLQLISGHYREDILFALGKIYQSETGK